MTTMSTYILACIIIAFVLLSAVIVHLLLGFHKQVVLKPKTGRSHGRTPQMLDETLFQSSMDDL